MLTYKIVDGNFTVQNQFYQATLSSSRGGTFTSLKFKGMDTGLFREGCEYWVDGGEHFEQEFSPVANIEIFDKSKDYIMLKTTARLVSPSSKKDGGYCIVYWLFRDKNPIICSKYQVFPALTCDRTDKYVCFRPDYYDAYSIIKKDGSFDLGKIGDEKGVTKADGWWYREAYLKWASFRNEKIGFSVIPNELNITGIWKSKSMTEIKTQQNNVFYLPYFVNEEGGYMNSVLAEKDNIFRETRLKTFIVQVCKTELKNDVNAEWFKRTLKEHNRGLWFLKVKDKYLRDGMRVLDLGGGIGAWGAYLIYVHKLNLHYINVDSNSGRIEASQKLFNCLGIKGDFFVQNVGDINFSNQDVILCFGVSYDLDASLFKLASQMLKKEGFFFLNIIEKSTNHAGYKFCLNTPEIKSEMEKVGFEILEMGYCGKYPNFNDIGVIARKR